MNLISWRIIELFRLSVSSQENFGWCVFREFILFILVVRIIGIKLFIIHLVSVGSWWPALLCANNNWCLFFFFPEIVWLEASQFWSFLRARFGITDFFLYSIPLIILQYLLFCSFFFNCYFKKFFSFFFPLFRCFVLVLAFVFCFVLFEMEAR